MMENGRIVFMAGASVKIPCTHFCWERAASTVQRALFGSGDSRVVSWPRVVHRALSC
jgi:hypothetical protein